MFSGKMDRRSSKREQPAASTQIAEKEGLSGRRLNQNRVRFWKRRKLLSPSQMTVFMAVSIFLCEAFAMYLINQLDVASEVEEAVIDAIILLVLLTPLYLLFYRPFWNEHQALFAEIKHLSRNLLRTTEDERKRIGHDLHDQCGQTLTALQFGFVALKKELPEECLQSEEQITKLSALLSQLSDEMREVTLRLRPDLLDQLGLVASLKNLVSEFSSNNPQIKIFESYDVGEQDQQYLDNDIEVAIYRICRECLNNISKYAQAPAVIVRLEKKDSEVILNMGDQGVGFDPRPPRNLKIDKRQGIGLIGIRERVADLGGSFTLSTEIGKGTFITVKLPSISRSENG